MCPCEFVPDGKGTVQTVSDQQNRNHRDNTEVKLIGTYLRSRSFTLCHPRDSSAVCSDSPIKYSCTDKAINKGVRELR